MPYLKQKTPTSRILDIVKRLYTFEKLQSTSLAIDYDVSSRTIHRDMLKISETILLHNHLGTWSLDTSGFVASENTFHKALLLSFAQNVEIEVECLEKSNASNENIAFAIEYKHLPKILGEKVIQAIQNEKQCSFSYVKDDETSNRCIDPIKIYTENGRWYVIARDYKDDKVKSFNLSKIKNFKQESQNTTLTQSMQEKADSMKSIWSSTGEDAILVKLYIQPEVVPYIKDIRLHKTQVIYDVHHDGGLEVHCTITHKLELLPQIKYWLPRIYVLEPKWLYDELMSDLEIYRDESLKFDI